LKGQSKILWESNEYSGTNKINMELLQGTKLDLLPRGTHKSKV
jgi:hypothetical protein